jgi:hypothetical protein
VRRCTTTCSIEGAWAAAWSAFSFSGTLVPFRQPSSWVIRIFAPESRSRSARDSDENPPNTTMWGAPIRAHASMAIGSSGIMPM